MLSRHFRRRFLKMLIALHRADRPKVLWCAAGLGRQLLDQ